MEGGPWASNSRLESKRGIFARENEERLRFVFTDGQRCVAGWREVEGDPLGDVIARVGTYIFLGSSACIHTYIHRYRSGDAHECMYLLYVV